MQFRHSAVTSLTSEKITESAPTPPRDIHPILLGSGRLAFGVDATGMQGLNTRMNQYRDVASRFSGNSLTACNLHLYLDQALSGHYDATSLAGESQAFSLLPCGWFDYVLTIAGHPYDSAKIQQSARHWVRSFEPDSGQLEISYTLAGINVEIQAVIAPESNHVDYHFQFRPLAGHRLPRLSIETRLHFTLRDGSPIASGGMDTTHDKHSILRSWKGRSDTSTAPLYAETDIIWGIAGEGTCQSHQTSETISLIQKVTGPKREVGVRIFCGLNRSGELTPSRIQKESVALTKSGSAACVESAQLKWKKWFSHAPCISLGDPKREYLLLLQQYIEKAGHPWRSGIPLGTLWTRNFSAATFWDSFFCADGMLRCGHVEEVRQFCRFLVRTMAPEGRPHYWMTWHDGKPVNPTGDIAYQVMLAYAGICSRLYAFTKDRRDLTEICEPYLRRVAEFFLNEVVVHEGEGRIRMKGALAHDVGIAATPEDADKNPGVLSWIITTLARYGELARLAGLKSDLQRTCTQVDMWYRQNPVNLSKPGFWDTWLPHLTSGEVHSDYPSWWSHCEALFGRIPMSVGSGQPWGNMSISAAMSITGHTGLALQLQEEAMKFVYGAGYFCEFSPEEREGWAFSPYPPATGAFLSSLLSFFAHGNVWSDDIQIGTFLPVPWRYGRLSWNNVHTLNGACVSAEWTPSSLDLSVETTRPRLCHIRIPSRIAGEPLHVRLNGKKSPFEISGEELILKVGEGSSSIVIRQDLKAPSDILILEPFQHGESLVELFSGAGLKTRWLRNADDMPALLGRTKKVFIHISLVSLPRDHVVVLENFVKKGGLLVVTYHAACPQVNARFSELTGVCASLRGAGVFDDKSEVRTFSLTKEGRKFFPKQKAGFEMPCCHHFYDVTTAPDVTVLAREIHEGVAQPGITSRRFGKGEVRWLSSGGKFMDRQYWGWYETYRNQHLLDRNTEELADLKWLRDPRWREVISHLVSN